jgi:hypothetical protein
MSTKRTLWWGAAIGVLVLGAATATAQSPPAADAGPGRVLERETDIRQAWELYSQIDERQRVRRALLRAKQVLSQAGVTLDESVWEAAAAALHEQEYARSAEERAAAVDAVPGALAPIQAALLAVVPPVAAFDHANDEGMRLGVAWRPRAGVVGYEIERREVPGEGEPTPWVVVKKAPSTGYAVVDEEHVRLDHRYEYRVYAVLSEEPRERELLGESATVRATAQWVNTELIAFFVFMMVICGAVVFFIERAKRTTLYIRKIAGLEAVDEAVGRATEMGRPVIFVPGIGGMGEIQTLAGLIVLGRVSRTAAEHDALLEVPTIDPIVMTAARETVQTSFVNAGRPDAFDEKKVYFSTADQFAYVGSICGTMVREKPAACFYMGSFFAESLILAETGNAIGSIQIAGTAQPHQLPFFVAACDYTLIGEEFFAASAYLSGEPQQLGSLKGQDAGKLLVGLFLVVGTVLATLAKLGEWQFTWVGDVLDYIRLDILKPQF